MKVKKKYKVRIQETEDRRQNREKWKNGVLEHWSDGVLERGEDSRLSNLRPAAFGTAEDGCQGFRLRYSYAATRRRGKGDRIKRNGRMEYWSIGVMEYWKNGMMGKEKSLPASLWQREETGEKDGTTVEARRKGA